MSRSCYNKTYAAGYWVAEKEVSQFGVEWTPKWIPHVNTADCRYDKMHCDPECIGCKWNPTPDPDPVYCPECCDWTVPDIDGDCPMCGNECRESDYDYNEDR